MADCRLVPVLLHHTLASTTDGRTPPCLSPAALIAVTARCCECVPLQEPAAATAGTSVVTETGGVTVLPEWGGTKVLPDYMDVRGILNTFAKARALHLRGPPAEWQTGADASAGVGAEVSLVLFPLLEALELEDCGISRLVALPSSLHHLAVTRHRGASAAGAAGAVVGAAGAAGAAGVADLGSFLRGAEQLLSLSWTCGELRSSRGAGALRGLQRLDLSRNSIERVEVHACMCVHACMYACAPHMHRMHAACTLHARCTRCPVCAVVAACRDSRAAPSSSTSTWGTTASPLRPTCIRSWLSLGCVWSTSNPKPNRHSHPNPKPEPYL